MKNNKRSMPKILLGISIVIVIISVVCGLGLSFLLKYGLDNMPEMMIDGADFAQVIKFMGYIAFPITVLYIIGASALLSLIPIGFMWGIYGIVLLTKKIIEKKLWWVFGVVLICILVIISISLIINSKPKLEENTIGSIAYDYDGNTDYTVYIKEDLEYIPYLVLTYNYNKTGDALCLRKNIIGGKNGYIVDYNGTIAEDKIYDEWLNMYSYHDYEQTDIDKYLNGEFLNKIDKDMLNKISNTNLSFSDYENGVYNNYDITRKFFILSLTELGISTSFDNKSKNKMVLDYFNSNESRRTNNEIGVECPWWTRTRYGGWCAVGYTGGIITNVTTDAKYGVRPAFTISNTSKIKQIYNEELNKQIYIFE